MSNKFNKEFKELRSLGSGGFSTVFEAISIKDDERYAIKKIPFTDEERERTLKETKFLNELKSDFVVFCIDWWIESNYYIGSFKLENQQNISSSNLLYSPYKPLLLHIQMELCSLTLYSFIEKMNVTKPNSLTKEQYSSVCDILNQILECVQYLHSLDPPIIHRDLKPENVMLIISENGYKVKLTDFGLSTYHNYIEQSHTKYIGTQSYRAPEVDRKQYDTKADIYSLGKIMENLFHFDFDSDSNEIESDIYSKYEKAKQVCVKCVSYSAKQRPDCQKILMEKHSWVYKNLSTNTLYDNSSEKPNNQLLKILFEKFPLLNKIQRSLLFNCNKLAIIEESEEKVIFSTKDRNIYSLRVCENIDSNTHQPIIINELLNTEIQSIESGLCHVLCLTDEMLVYSFGDNTYGQLGNGNKLSNNKPSIIEEFYDKRIIDIKCGSNHSLALSENGKVFAWGSGGFGQIGNGMNSHANKPKQLISFISEKIILISCGFNHCLALSESGTLYGWGSNGCGQLGIGNNCDQNKPIIVEFDDIIKIKKICCGCDHSLVLTDDYDIYSFGGNSFGQLGSGNNIHQNRPKLVQTTVKFADIETTFYHILSVGLSSDNIYYVWGECNDKSIQNPKPTNFNTYYETFVYYSLNCKVFPTTLTNESFIKSNTFRNKINEWSIFKPLNQEMMSNLKSFCVIRLKEIKAILVSNEDIVYSFRLNESIDRIKEESFIVNELSHKNIKSITCGMDHVLYLTKNNEIYSYGDNRNGQLGNGSQINNLKPSIINNLINRTIIEISCGAYHCIALSESGKLYVWGYGYYGQIGNRSNLCQLSPIDIKSFLRTKIISISCGAYHCLVLTSSNEVYGWGHNKYGQLGIGNNANQNKPILIENPDKFIIKKVSCGRYHSLLLTYDFKIYSFGSNRSCQLGIDNAINQNKMIRIGTKIKFTDIHTNWWNNFSAALSQTGKYYIWGKCGEDLITQPEETEFTSFDGIMAKFSRSGRITEHMTINCF